MQFLVRFDLRSPTAQKMRFSIKDFCSKCDQTTDLIFYVMSLYWVKVHVEVIF